MYALNGELDRTEIIPNVDNTVNDIYLVIAVFVLKYLTPSDEIHNLDKNSLYEIKEEHERLSLYSETIRYLKKQKIKVLFNILDDSHLLNQIDIIETYPNDFEVTLPTSIEGI